MASAGVVETGLLEVSLTRRVAAPLDVVFAVWTEAKHLAEWWGPKCFTNPVCEVEARMGGAILIHMHGPDGTVYPMKGRFVEFDRPYRLVFTITLMDGEGRALFETRNTVMFAEVRGGTEISLCAQVTSTTPEAPRHLAGMSQGWSQSLDRLAELVVRM
jgi:uncharacterized protein YndB with AHSA1/START domain